MSREKEEADVREDRKNSKTVSNKTDDRHKLKRKHGESHNSESKNEAISSNHSSTHKSSRNLSNTHTNRNPPRKNIAQNRLKKLRTKLDTEIKLKEKIETVGISRLLDESVVKVEKSTTLPNKHKLPKIPRIDNRSGSGSRNIASSRLKKVQKETQAVVKYIEGSGSNLESPLEPTLSTSKLHLELTLSTLKPPLDPTLPTLKSTSKPVENRDFILGSGSISESHSEPALSTSKPHLDPTFPTLKSTSQPILEPVEDRDSFMEVDEDISETDTKVSNQKYISNTVETSVSHGSNVSNNINDTNFSDITYKINSRGNIKEPPFTQSLNVSDNDSHFNVIPFINDEISKIRNEPSYKALHTNFLLDIKMEVDTPDGDLLIVIDTNVFLSHLNIVSYLLTNSSIPGLSSSVLVVPWLVIQEIDCAMKRNNDRLNSQARFANNFINDCLKKKNSRFFAQSLIDFKDNFKNAVNVDDFILQYCMNFVALNKKVILLTNDKNLSNKAMINNLTVFSTKEFVNSFDLSEFF